MKIITNNSLIALLGTVLFLFCTGCLPRTTQFQPWTVEDLRYLDAPVDSLEPSLDVTAIYTRLAGSDVEIRIEFMDLPLESPNRYQLRLDTLPGGDPWEFIMDLPASGSPSVLPAGSGIHPRVVLNPWLDFITVRFNRLTISSPFNLQVASFAAGANDPSDISELVRSDSLPPINRAPLALVFWDTFKAATPAQALRRWDGAHSGPSRESHGLKHLLDAIEAYQVPVALLDIKTPARLSALAYLGQLSYLQQLAAERLLVLPDVTLIEQGLEVQPAYLPNAETFGLTASPFVYNPWNHLERSATNQFIRLDQSSILVRSNQLRLLPVPGTQAFQAGPDGPGLDLRKALLSVAFSTQPSRLVVAGGQFSASTWGNENSAAPSMAWIAARPWIKPLDGTGLLAFPLGARLASQPASEPTPSALLSALISSPANSISSSAWLTYSMLTAPDSSPQLQALHRNYLGVVWQLLAAASWAEHPSPGQDCSVDLDQDSSLECLLANRQLLAILDPESGQLDFLFYLGENGPKQVIGPSSQFAVGLSDESEWELGRGDRADPAVIPGAFADQDPSIFPYWASILPGGISFTSQDGSRVKNYKLLGETLQFSFRGMEPADFSIPLVVDPESFFNGVTEYESILENSQFTWGSRDGFQASVRMDTGYSLISITDSLQLLAQGEDPDRAYPAGHFLPFPLAVVSTRLQSDSSIQMVPEP